MYCTNKCAYVLQVGKYCVNGGAWLQSFASATGLASSVVRRSHVPLQILLDVLAGSYRKHAHKKGGNPRQRLGGSNPQTKNEQPFSVALTANSQFGKSGHVDRAWRRDPKLGGRAFGSWPIDRPDLPWTNDSLARPDAALRQADLSPPVFHVEDRIDGVVHEPPLKHTDRLSWSREAGQ